MVSHSRNGIYRSVFAALIGVALLGAGEYPSPKANPEKTKAEQHSANAAPVLAPITAEPLKTIKPSEYEWPCEEGGNNRNSDLCAQWKAADAAKDAAGWAMRSFWIGILGFLGLLASLYYTRKAVKVAHDATKDADRALEIAARNADAAAAHVEIAKDMAERQLRPYVYIEKADKLDPNNLARQVVLVKLRNFGKTPAKNMKTKGSYRWCKAGSAIAARLEFNPAHVAPDMPPAHTQPIRCPIDFPDGYTGPRRWDYVFPQVESGQIILVVCISFGYQWGDKTERRDEVLVFDRDGPRQAQPEDNLTYE